MAEVLQEITITFSHEKHRWDETVIGIGRTATPSDHDASKTITFKATGVLEGDLVPDLTYRLYGRWAKTQYGQQFHAKTYIRAQPHGRTGVLKYLQFAPNIGEKVAEKLWDAFGGEAVRIAREAPDVAAAAVAARGTKSFTVDKAKEAAEYLSQQARLEACSIDMIDLLSGRGFPRDTARRAVQEWGNKAPEMIRRCPYILMRFRGCGFLRVDAMYLDLGKPNHTLKRQALCAWHACVSDTEGHTWLSKETIEKAIKDKVGGAYAQAAKAVKLGIRSKMLAIRRDAKGQIWVAESRRARSEATIAKVVAETETEDPQWPVVDQLACSEHQKERLALATTGVIGILCGSPGTGKTYTASALIEKVIEEIGFGEVAVCAPTGKAAVRITEAMRARGIPLVATTIHKMLRVAARDDRDGWGFEHNKSHPLPFRVVIVDEASMIDANLMAALVDARGRGTHVLFIGDPNQLPPIGHGSPLTDMIAAGVPCGELRVIERNDGTIVQACAAIRDRRPIPVDKELDPATGKNLKVLPAGTGETAARKIVEALQSIGRKRLADRIWDCQVIVAVNEKSSLSRKTLNDILQRELNPAGQTCQGNKFRVGDKVVCTKNGFMLAVDESDDAVIDWSDCGGNLGLTIIAPATAPAASPAAVDGKHYVANGEIGRVVEVSPKVTVIRFDDPRRMVKVVIGGNSEGDDSEKGGGTACNIELAYAISCHKSQGSEWPIVIVALDEYPGARLVCSRNWIYTAISRAKKVCLLVGKQSTAESFAMRDAISQRKTFLVDRIAEERSELEKCETFTKVITEKVAKEALRRCQLSSTTI